MLIGSLIRKHRKEQKLTLKTVAGKAGISEGFLSQVENNVNSPSVDTLLKICDAINVKAGDLLNQVNDQERIVFISKTDWDEFDIPHTGFATQRFFSPSVRVVLDSAILIVEPGASIPVRKNVKNGQEVLCVIDGSLDLVYGEHTYPMKKGDAVHFWADPKRQYLTNRSEKRAVALWVGTL